MLYQAGMSRKRVTPPLGIAMGGHPGYKRAARVLDELYSRSLAIADRNTTVVLTSVDVLFLNGDSIAAIREACAGETGLPASCFHITSTHTHSGPLTSGTFGRDGEADYLSYMESQIIASIVEAVAALAPAELYAAKTRAAGLGFCERIIMRGGRVETHPYKWDDDIVTYESVADDELGALLVKGADGRWLGGYVNYANHPQVMERENDGLSADFPGRLDRHLQAAWGDDVMMLFGPGACGDICPVDSLNPRHAEIGEAWCDRVGQQLAEAVLSAVAAARPLSGPIRTAQDTVRLRRRAIPPHTLDEARRFLADYRPSGKSLTVSNYGVEPEGTETISLESYLSTAEWKEQEYTDLLLLDEMCQDSPDEAVELGGVAIGQLGIVTLPFEVFSEIGLCIKEHSPFERTFVVELTNGAAGYLPTVRAFQRPGSYEVVTLRTSRFVPEAADIVSDAAIALLRSLQSADSETGGEA